MLCPKCNTDHAHRSHRRGPAEYLASIFAVYPYRCAECGSRYLRSRYTAPETPAGANCSTELEIKATRSGMKWKRTRREFLLYSAGLGFFMIFLYFITRERSSPSDGN